MRSKEIDFLRGVAVMMVVFFHHPFGWSTFASKGASGVPLFFVLSGFLVGGLLFRELKKKGRIDYKNFLIRRGFKIYPLYYLLIGLAAGKQVISYYIFHRESPLMANPEYKWMLLREVSFTTNIWEGSMVHLWSLALEEQFYILFPLLLILLHKANVLSKTKYYLGFVLSVMAICSAWRIFWPAKYYLPGQEISLYYPQYHVDTLLFGTLLAYLFIFQGDLLRHYFQKLDLFITPLSWVCIFVVFSQPKINAYGAFALYLSFGIVLMGFAYYSRLYSWLKDSPLLHWPYRALYEIGYYSYGIYLFHLFSFPWLVGGVCKLISPTSTEMTWLNLGIYSLMAIALGILLSRAIEYPLLRLRDRMFPSPTVVG